MVLVKKTRVFLDQRGPEFKRQHRAVLTLKKAKKLQRSSRDMTLFLIRACPGSTWATPGADRRRGKNENFF